VENIISSPRFSLAPQASFTVAYRLYFGPKDLDILKAQGSRLDEVINFGWFSAIAKPLLHTLQFFYKYVGNYGLAIIIITVILKALFYPLTNKSYKSMKDMQKLQPKMAELKEKYKNDRDAMNKAVMELYKTHKVNPMGGCLPMVIQIPVFFALYKALMFSIELRHAPFILWIKDLSAPDSLFGVIPSELPLVGGMPIGPLPLLMGATMVIQQKMTPSNMDPAQAKMMMALPFVFTFMFLNFPSGLVLYWLVNNILTIAQQAYINKSLKGS
jgi:YidC/Oxa1 family membrane protein insertase